MVKNRDSSAKEQALWKRWDKLNAARNAVFDSDYQTISQYFYPSVSDINTEKTESITGWYDRIYDTAPIRAATTCSVGVRNWVTPSTEPWLDLSPPSNLLKQPAVSSRVKRLQTNSDDNAAGVDDAQRWCADTSSTCLQELASSSFYSVVQPFNKSACVFGTALMFCEEGKAASLRFEQFKVGTFVIAENDQKIVDTVIRRFKLTVRQAVQKFCPKLEDGKYDTSEMPEKLAKAYASEKFDETFYFLHHVMPNEDYQRGKMGADGMAFASIYQAELGRKIVKEGGYEEMPYFCLRWKPWGSDDQPYGTSPGYEVLPEARQLNMVTQFSDALAELKAFPRFLYPDNLDGDIQLAAGGVTTYEADKPNAIPREWQTVGEQQEVLAMLERKEQAINKAFFVDIFTMLAQMQDKRMTATEVALRNGEKLDQFTGTFDQYRTDFITPLVKRIIGILFRSGKLKDAPPSLMVQPGDDPKADPELAMPKINIKSRVTLALNEVRNVGVQKTVEMLLPLGEQKPEIMDNFNWDEVARGTARNNGMPEAMLLPIKQMLEVRQQRTKMLMEQRALDQAKTASEAGKNLGKAPQQLQDQVTGQLTGQAA